MMHGNELETPETGLVLENREEPVGAPARKRPERSELAAELRALREETAGLRREREQAAARLAAARKVKPQGAELHCGLCFSRGRDAALAVMEGTRKA